MSSIFNKILSHPAWTAIGVIATVVIGFLTLVKDGPDAPSYIESSPTDEKAVSFKSENQVSSSGISFGINKGAIKAAKETLLNLDKTNNAGTGFDYWPKGGLRITYDHIRSMIKYREFVSLVPVEVFLSGPHSNLNLSLNEKNSFGYYNPVFVDWLSEHITDVLSDGIFVETSKPLFDKYLKGLVFAYWDTYRALENDESSREALKTEYLELIDHKALPETYYYRIAWKSDEYDFLKELEKRHDINVLAPAVYFWFRRSADGTAERFYNILDKILRSYDYTFGFYANDHVTGN